MNNPDKTKFSTIKVGDFFTEPMVNGRAPRYEKVSDTEAKGWDGKTKTFAASAVVIPCK